MTAKRKVAAGIKVLFMFAFIFSSQSARCDNKCGEAIKIDDALMFNFTGDIYLSDEGKLYEPVNCDDNLSQAQKNEYEKLLGIEAKLEEKHSILRKEFLDLKVKASSRYEYSLITDKNPNYVQAYRALLSKLDYRSNYDLADGIKMEIVDSSDALDEGKTSEAGNINILRRFNYYSNITTTKLLIENQIELSNVLKDINDIQSEIRQFRKKLDDGAFYQYPTRSDQKYIQSPTNGTEISPVYYRKFILLERELTLDEALSLKKTLLSLISEKLTAKYANDANDYSVLENNGSILRSRIDNLSREITNSNWENIELTITPVIASSTQIDISISALLFTKSGFKYKVPDKSNFKYSDDYKALEEYVSKLVVYFREAIPKSNIEIKD